MTLSVLLGLSAGLAVVAMLTFTSWRLWVLDRQQAQLYEDFVRLQGDTKAAQRQQVHVIASQLDSIEAVLIHVANQTETATEWARWWASELARGARP